MKNDYECPKCHNVFPSSYIVMHDARCTEDNPMPLDQSRQISQNNQNNSIQNNNRNQSHNNKKNEQEKPPEIIPNIDVSQSNSQIEPSIRNFIEESNHIPNTFICEKCGETLPQSEKNDHMLCHNLENEDQDYINDENNLGFSQRTIDEQKEIERLIKQQNERRRPMPSQQNERNRQHNSGNRRNHINLDPDNNILLNDDQNMLRNMVFPGMISGFPQIGRRSSNPIGHQNLRITRTGLNGERILQQFSSNNNDDMNQLNNMFSNMRISPLDMFSNNNQRRRNNPFDNINNMDAILEQLLGSLGNYEHPTDQQILNELPETQIDDVTKLSPEKKNCVICLEDFKNGEKATVLPCLHLFHNNCIQNWLKTQDCCPICKFKLTVENLNP